MAFRIRYSLFGVASPFGRCRRSASASLDFVSGLRFFCPKTDPLFTKIIASSFICSLNASSQNPVLDRCNLECFAVRSAVSAVSKRSDGSEAAPAVSRIDPPSPSILKNRVIIF
jgi:hypothetical protein